MRAETREVCARVNIGQLLARCTFPPTGSSVTCAVSGGADSMALMVLAHEAGLVVRAVHVNHGVRPDSARDIDLISPVARRYGIEVSVVSVDVTDGPNFEARARDARYGVMPPDVLTGHTADDQAETVLVNLLRGAGARGLGAMRPGVRRPLLGLRRHETHELCASLGVEVVDDTTNRDPRFQRNRVRHEILPIFADISRRDPVPLLCRTADALREDDDLLDELALEIDPTDAVALSRAPRPLARRAIRRWLSDPYPPDAATIERVIGVARGDATACDIGENRQIRRSKQRLSLQHVG